MDRTRLTGPLAFFLESLARNRGVGTLNGEKLCLGRDDQTIGAFPAGVRTARKAVRPRRCACVTAKAAVRSGIGPHPRPRTAVSAGTFAKPMQPNTTRTGTISRG